MHYNGHRYYDTDTGKYITKDPIGFLGKDINLYRYVKNNPLKRIDPTGLEAEGKQYCGSGSAQVPSLWFNSCCYDHDRCYDYAPKCPEEEAKKAKEKCDKEFKGCMTYECSQINGVFIGGVCYVLADIYGFAVGAFGDDAFKKAKPSDTPDDPRYPRNQSPIDPKALDGCYQ